MQGQGQGHQRPSPTLRRALLLAVALAALFLARPWLLPGTDTIETPTPTASGGMAAAPAPTPVAFEEAVLGDGTRLYQLPGTSAHAFFATLARDSSAGAALRTALAEVWRDCGEALTAIRWECPPITAATADATPMEFVVKAYPQLAGVSPEGDTFAAHMHCAGAPAVAFPNLSGDATLVVPCIPAASPHADYSSLAPFARLAPRADLDAFLQLLGRTVVETVAARGARPTYVSTAGGGVYWLHVRLDSRPKYYAHRPYAQPVGGAPEPEARF